MVWTQRSLRMSLEHGTERKTQHLQSHSQLFGLQQTLDSSQGAFDSTLNFTKAQNTEYSPQGQCCSPPHYQAVLIVLGGFTHIK